MSEEHRALIESVRKEHIDRGGQGLVCVDCLHPWPCLAARLAEALEQEIKASEELADGIVDAVQMQGSANARAAGWSIDLEDALARLAAAEAKVQRILDAYHQSYRHGPDSDPKRCLGYHAAALEDE